MLQLIICSMLILSTRSQSKCSFPANCFTGNVIYMRLNLSDWKSAHVACEEMGFRLPEICSDRDSRRLAGKVQLLPNNRYGVWGSSSIVPSGVLEPRRHHMPNAYLTSKLNTTLQSGKKGQYGNIHFSFSLTGGFALSRRENISVDGLLCVEPPEVEEVFCPPINVEEYKVWEPEPTPSRHLNLVNLRNVAHQA